MMGKRSRYTVNTTDLHKLEKKDLLSLARMLMDHFQPSVEKEIEEKFWAGYWYRNTNFFIKGRTDVGDI